MIEYTVKVYDDQTEWYLNGRLHRVDGPAVEYANGDKLWHLNGKRHRVDGPAVEYANGNEGWYLNGRQVTETEVMTQSKELTVDEIEAILGYSVKIVK